jgi:hypothetical protein
MQVTFAESYITEAVKRELERGEYISLYDMGDNGEVTPEALQSTRKLLRAFPNVCLRAQEAEGIDKIILDGEIRMVKNALTGISKDPFYQIVPDLHFRNFSFRDVSFRMNRDLGTIKRNDRRLLKELALRLFGVVARWRHPQFGVTLPAWYTK